MTVQSKDFRVKNGLVVEGTTATVNGNEVLTTASDLGGLIEAGVGLGSSYPTDKANGSLFFNTSTLRLAVLYDSMWRELAYLADATSIDGGNSATSIDGGNSATTVFQAVYDNGDSTTDVFVGNLNGGTS